jgi:hypothetical protein
MDGASAASADALLQAIVHGIDTIEAIRSCARAYAVILFASRDPDRHRSRRRHRHTLGPQSDFSSLSTETGAHCHTVITFDQEVNFLWNRERRWSTGRVLFVIVRLLIHARTFAHHRSMQNRYYTLLAAVYNLYSLFTTNLTDKVGALTSREGP